MKWDDSGKKTLIRHTQRYNIGKFFKENCAAVFVYNQEKLSLFPGRQKLPPKAIFYEIQILTSKSKSVSKFLNWQSEFDLFYLKFYQSHWSKRLWWIQLTNSIKFLNKIRGVETAPQQRVINMAHNSFQILFTLVEIFWKKVISNILQHRASRRYYQWWISVHVIFSNWDNIEVPSLWKKKPFSSFIVFSTKVPLNSQ